jgi:hypothetical protein
MKQKAALMLSGCLCASGCVTRASPVAVHPTDNAEVKVEHLFTHDGCAVYRFRDAGYHYYVRCDGAGSAMTHSLEPCGKSCRVDQTIQTFGAPATRGR